MWERLLEACVESVAAVGLDIGVWAYSNSLISCVDIDSDEEGSEYSYVGDQQCFHKQFVAGDLYNFCAPCLSSPNVRIHHG